MRILKKVIILIIIVAIIVPIFYFINEIWGNPISKAIAKSKAKDYLEEHYEVENLRIDRVVYNFKIDAYSADIVSDSSIDTHFSVYITKLGKVLGDSYDQEVVNGWNTYCRIDETYRDIVDSVIMNHNLNVNSDINFGTIKLLEKSDYMYGVEFGVQMSSLEIDKQYDINELSKSAGHIIYYALSEDVSLEKACELLLQIKQAFDDERVPFYAIDLELRESNGEKPALDGDSIHVKEFLYTDIDQAGLEERVKAAHDRLSAYYNEKDAEKEAH